MLCSRLTSLVLLWFQPNRIIRIPGLRCEQFGLCTHFVRKCSQSGWRVWLRVICISMLMLYSVLAIIFQWWLWFGEIDLWIVRLVSFGLFVDYHGDCVWMEYARWADMSAFDVGCSRREVYFASLETPTCGWCTFTLLYGWIGEVGFGMERCVVGRQTHWRWLDCALHFWTSTVKICLSWQYEHQVSGWVVDALILDMTCRFKPWTIPNRFNYCVWRFDDE